MAFSSPTDRGTAVLATADASFAFSPASNCTPGALIVVCLALDNAGTLGAGAFVSIEDSLGNAWSVDGNAIFDPGAASEGVQSVIAWTLQDVGQITTSTTITATFSASAKACATVSEVQGTVPEPADNGGPGSGANTDVPSVTTASLASGQFLVACCGSESANDFTGDGDTTNGSWSSQQAAGTGSGLTGMSLTSQYKILSGTGAQTYNPTKEFAADCVLAWVSFAEGAAPANGPRDLLLLRAG